MPHTRCRSLPPLSPAPNENQASSNLLEFTWMSTILRSCDVLTEVKSRLEAYAKKQRRITTWRMWNTYIYTHVLLAFLYNRNQLIDHPLRPVVSHAKGRNNRTRNRTMLTRLSARRQGEKEKRARPQRRRSTLIIKITPPRGSFFLPNDRSQCQLLFAPSPPLLLIFLRRKKEEEEEENLRSFRDL